MRVQVGDIRLFVDFDGEGLTPDGPDMREKPVLVLVHGGPGTNDHSHYKPYLSPLTDVAQLLYYDHRGNGRSDRSSPEHWNLSQWADDLKALLDVLGIERPIVMGVSFGGFVAQAFAIQHSQDIAGLILCSTSSRARIDRIAAVMERLGGKRARQIAERFWLDTHEVPSSGEGPLHPAMQEYIDVCCPLYLRSSSLDMDLHTRTRVQADVMFHWKHGDLFRFDLLDQLHSITCPTLVLAGEDDPVTTFADARDMYESLSREQATFVPIPNAGHPTYQDEPERTFDEIRTFIGQVW